jgi:hypothetical protein
MGHSDASGQSEKTERKQARRAYKAAYRAYSYNIPQNYTKVTLNPKT